MSASISSTSLLVCATNLKYEFRSEEKDLIQSFFSLAYEEFPELSSLGDTFHWSTRSSIASSALTDPLVSTSTKQVVFAALSFCKKRVKDFCWSSGSPPVITRWSSL